MFSKSQQNCSFLKKKGNLTQLNVCARADFNDGCEVCESLGIVIRHSK